MYPQQTLRQQRFSITLLLLLLISLTLPAAELPERGWTIGPSIGVHWGGAREIVYDNSGVENKNEYLSLLTWDLQPTVVMGIETRWESGKAGGLDLIFRFGIPGMTTGEMWDYDWLTANDPIPTLWSVSDIWLRWGFIFDVGYDWNIISKGFFSLNAGLGYHLDWWAWRDTLKELSYVPKTAEIGENGIDYSAAYHVPLVSLAVNLNWKIFFLNVNGRIGPVLAFSHDHHKKRDTFGPDGAHFYDSAAGGPWVDALLETGFRSSGRFIFTLKGEFAWLNETRGNTIVVPTDGSSSWMIADAAGFAFSRIGVTALFSWDLSGS